MKGQFKHKNKTIKWKFYIKTKLNDCNEIEYLPITKYKIERKFSRQSIFYARWVDEDLCLNYFYKYYLEDKLSTMIEREIIQDLQEREKRKILKKLFNI